MSYEDLELPADTERVQHASAMMVREWVGQYRYRLWGDMLYGCAGCGWSARIGLGAGVEGPPVLREKSIFVPAPFTITCPGCSGTASHRNWVDDQDFGKLRAPDNNQAFFIVGWGQGAELVNRSAL